MFIGTPTHNELRAYVDMYTQTNTKGIKEREGRYKMTNDGIFVVVDAMRVLDLG